MKCKPVVYFSERHTLSPAVSRALKSLSRHVTVVGQCKDPEIAYATVNECDVFLLYLNPVICQNLFLTYELGVALVLRKPVIVIRETDLKFSEILIPKHFYETRLLIRPHKTGSLETCCVFGKTYNFPLTLGDVLHYGFENSVVFCPDLQAKCIALLLDKILSLSRELGVSLSRQSTKSPLKPFQKPGVEITPQNSKSLVGSHGCSIATESGFNKAKISLLPLKKYEMDTTDALKSNLLVNEHKLGGNEKGISFNCNPEISINELGNDDELHSLKPVNPVINEFPSEMMSSREDADDGLDTSDSSTCDMAYLHDKTFTASENTSPLPSPIPPRGVYYPTALPVYPMEISFPPFQIEKLPFDKHAIKIAKADRLPSTIRRRIMRKGL